MEASKEVPDLIREMSRNKTVGSKRREHMAKCLE
jgi:hypothetical protein